MNVSSNCGDIDTRMPSHHRLPVWANQKLLKVPLDVSEFERLPEQSAGEFSKAVSNGRAGVLKRPGNETNLSVKWIIIQT